MFLSVTCLVLSSRPMITLSRSRGWYELHALPQGNPDPSQRNGEGGCFGTNQAIKATALVKVLEK